MRLLTNPRILAGAVLDLVGLGLVVSSLPDGGVPLAAGVACLLAGAALITRALSSVGEDPAAASEPSADWSLDPALRQPLPRRTQIKRLGIVIAACWVMALAALGWFAASRTLGLNPPIPSQALVAAAGDPVTAEIHEKVVRETSQGQPRYYLYYSYEYPEGSETRSSVAVTPTLYDRYQVNDVLQLQVLPSDPPVVLIPELTRDPFALRGLILGAVVAALLLVYLDSQRRRHKRLVRTGLPVAATAAELRRRGASRTYQARYRVGSTEYSVRASERNPQRRNGNRVTVLHDPEKPSDALVYEAAVYRAVGKT